MKNKKLRWIMIVAAIILVTGGVLWVLAGKWMQKGLEPKADGSREYAIVLGAKVKPNNIPSLSLRYRLEAALEYANQYPHVTFILSGGQGEDEPISEAAMMKDYLVQHGIDEKRLLMEDKSTSTYENLVFSKKLLPNDVKSVTIITSDYHLARAKMLAKTQDLQVDVVAAETPKVVSAKLRAREKLALLKTAFVGK